MQVLSIMIMIGHRRRRRGGGGGGTLYPPPHPHPKNGNQKFGHNAGRIRAKCGRKFGQKVEGKKETTGKYIRANSLEKKGKLVVFLSQ